ncbi:SDR family oxidoreductase [Catenulispora sp. GAS73]|uniref:SDR family oxidoreductase n=1 Tax=Catenulispora sp. GAS73 TaxID=3156269 RepID=UPI00351922E4
MNVSSADARVVSADPAHYNVAKAALSALTKVIAEQFDGRNVRAVTVSPGPIRTGVRIDPDGFIWKRRSVSQVSTLSPQLRTSRNARPFRGPELPSTLPPGCLWRMAISGSTVRSTYKIDTLNAGGIPG